jgi:hypothetical protein
MAEKSIIKRKRLAREKPASLKIVYPRELKSLPEAEAASKTAVSAIPPQGACMTA